MEKSFFDLVFDIPSDQTFTYKIDDKKRAAVGKRAMVPFGSRDCLGYIIAERESPPEHVKLDLIKNIRRVVDEETIFDTANIELARWMADFYLCSTGQAISTMIPSGRRLTIPNLPEDEETEQPTLSISNEQADALRAILENNRTCLQDPDSRLTASNPLPEMFYLFGVTGSGKTEVFIRAAQRFLSEGKSVIYLVPEISLTHQTAKMIGSRFGSQAATLHSGMSPSARFSEWMRIRRGEAPIVVGPRSAIFAPVKNLGLVIIDEEHDGSYKSGNTPRYHARQIAIRRCGQEGAKLVMGSATPSAEAWKLMSDNTIKRLNLTRRVSGGGMPEIKAVSLAKTDGCLTKELKDEIRITAEMGRQTILFMNRRGFAHFYQCPDCGYEQKCRHCSVSLTWHKAKGKCICHYCGYSEAPPKACANCGCVEAGFRGFGTEMIEEEVKMAFPDLKIRRVDADTAGKRGGLEDSLTLFKSGMIDILLGTQMVAKGLNFPKVRLVGVVFADTGLHMPDFRASERTFSLIVQVAGRAGRYFPDSKVIVQTLRLDDPVIKYACTLDVSGFFNSELNMRKALSFPPYTRLIRFTIRSKDEKKADAAIKRLALLIKPFLNNNAEMLGPAECPIGFMNNNYRRQLMLRGPSMGNIHHIAKQLIPLYEKGKDAKTYLEFDVDPVSML
ncbi:MAG: primosomal protein N' [Treponema sp.]|nr:primosomal protein N' [Treponema sp.]